MNEKSKVWFFTEIGNGIGFGHFSRCISLITALRKKFSIELYIFNKGYVEIPINPKLYNIKVSSWNIDSNELPNISQNDFVVVDSYLAQSNFYTQLTLKCSFTLALDDYYRINYNTKYVLNPNPSGEYEKYKQEKGSVLCGKNYVILNQSFRELKIKDVNKYVKSVVITVGGSDYRQLLPLFLSSFCPLYPEIKFEIVSANDAYKRQLMSQFTSENISIHGILSSSQMTSLFMQSDLAISASGQTLGECIASSLPFLAFSIDEDQKPIMNFYKKNSILNKNIEWDMNNFMEVIHEEFQFLLNGYSHRKKVVETGHLLIDRKGVERIVQLIEKCVYGF